MRSFFRGFREFMGGLEGKLFEFVWVSCFMMAMGSGRGVVLGECLL